MVSQSDADTSSHTTGRMRSSKARVQIIGRVSGRRNWTVEQKLAIIGEAFTSGSSVASTIERHEISSGQLYTWRRQLLDGELGGVRDGNLAQQNGLGFARVDATVRNARAATRLESDIVASVARRVRGLTIAVG